MLWQSENHCQFAPLLLGQNEGYLVFFWQILRPDCFHANSKEQEIWAEIDSDWYIGILTIPTLQVEVPIFSEYVFDQLPYTPCRYAGSYLTDNMIVAAHNYDSHFGRIRKLDSGDRIDFTDVTGTVYHYQVIQTEILPDTAVEEMEQGNWDLTLFTCTLSGTQRVTVRCERIS